jgi:hypothetical protein
LTFFGPELDRLLPGQLPALLEQRRLSAGHHLAEGDLEVLAPAVVTAGLEVEHLAAVADPGLVSGDIENWWLGFRCRLTPRAATVAAGCWGRCSRHLRRPTPLSHHVVGPALAAVGEVLPPGDEALVELAGEQGDAVHPGVMAEQVAGHADLAAAGRQQHLLVQVGPLLDQEASITLDQPRGAAQMHAHGLAPIRTSVLARVVGFRAATGNGGAPASAALVTPSDQYRRLCAEMGAWPPDDHPPTETGRYRCLICGAECRTSERWLFRLGLPCDCQGEFKGRNRLCQWPRGR